MPAWVGKDGYPLSWRHYCYGIAYIRRASARRQIENASATRMAKADQKNFEEWRKELGGHAGIGD